MPVMFAGDGNSSKKPAPAPVVKAPAPVVRAPNDNLTKGRGSTLQPITVRAPVRAPAPKPTYSAPKPTYSAPKQQNYSGAPAKTVSYGSSSNGGAQTFSAPAPAPAPVPATETITIPDAMADPNYQQQQTELARQMADFKAQQDLADAQYTGSYNQTTRKLGRNGDKWDLNLQNGQYGQTKAANTNDFAGRGLYNSGEYVGADSNVDADFNSRLGEIDRARTDFRDTAALSNRNMQSQQEATRQAALASAVASIAAKYGVNLDQVGRGQTTQITRPV